MTPQPLKIRADVEMKCFQFDGVLHIKVLIQFSSALICCVPLDLLIVDKMSQLAVFLNWYHCTLQAAMRKAEAAGTTECPVKIKLVAPPSYVLITQTLDKVSARV